MEEAKPSFYLAKSCQGESRFVGKRGAGRGHIENRNLTGEEQAE